MRKSCLKEIYQTTPNEPRNCNIKLQNLTFTSMIKKTKHILKEKKALKTLFHNKKNTTMKKKHKKHSFFKNTC